MSESKENRGDWFLTYTGKQFWPFDPRPEDICIRDIAHHLSLCCRFNGACRVHYSVAQHSMMVADILPAPLKFYGLMHDATEAYVGDMVRPLKRNLPEYQAVEELVWLAIVNKFNIATNFSSFQFYSNEPTPRQLTAAEKLKEADNVALMTERRDLLIASPKGWSTKADPLPGCIRPLTPQQAEIKFLETFDELVALRKH